VSGRVVDINADVGEGLEDERLMPHLTSVSVACGGHAGDRETMTAALRAAKRHGLRVGAHPGYPDRDHFGRVDIGLDPDVLADSLRQQLLALAEVAAEAGVRLTHVKAHGALYNRAWNDRALAEVVVAAVAGLDPAPALFCPPGSEQEKAAREAGLAVVREVFLDRGYSPQGRLIPRGEPGDIVSGSTALTQQISNIAGLEFETMCVHGDNPGALDLLLLAPALLAARGYQVGPYVTQAERHAG
jgi:5-oxoprolinase (ATP-hydrolysing) subunit A